MDYEIVTTLGPASARESVWLSLVSAGATAFRLNTSHLSLADLDAWLASLAPFVASTGRRLPVVLDLQGSKWRLGEFAPFTLSAGQTVELVLSEASQAEGVLPVPHPDFFAAAPLSGPEMALADAKVMLVNVSAGPDRMTARVARGGEISPRKGITYTNCAYRSESLSVKDREILAMTKDMSFVRYAVSYVKDTEEMLRYRELLGSKAYVIAKIERPSSLVEAIRIAAVVDELWLCRGDLGAETGVKTMAEAVRRFTDAVSGIPKPVFLAGQVLEHMVSSPAPTRSEVCCMYDALVMGYRGLVLSDETAMGSFPVESVATAAMFRD